MIIIVMQGIAMAEITSEMIGDGVCPAILNTPRHQHTTAMRKPAKTIRNIDSKMLPARGESCKSWEIEQSALLRSFVERFGLSIGNAP